MSVPVHRSADVGNSRIASIDATRAIAILSVVAIHCDAFSSARYAFGGVEVGAAIDLLARFAVPFFFITAGFLLGRKCRRNEDQLPGLRALVFKLGCLILFWYAVYLAWPVDWTKALQQGWLRTAYWNMAALFADPVNLLVGPRAHLWFLPALLVGAAHVVAVSATGRAGLSAFYFMALYLLGLGHGTYGAIPLFHGVGFGVPASLMAPPLLIAIGFWSARSELKVSSVAATWMFAIGTLSTWLEAWILLENFNVPLEGHDFLLGTPLQAYGLLCLLRIYPDWAKQTLLPVWGRYTLGIYAGHVAIVEQIGARTPGSFIWEFVKTPLVYAFTLATVAVLARSRLVRAFVT